LSRIRTRRHPVLYQINTWPWLESLSRRFDRHVTLGSLPEAYWDRLAARGIDVVYLMGVWRRSAIGRQIAQTDPGCCASYGQALPGWTIDDVVGSAFCVTAYEPDARIGTFDDLGVVRDELHARGMTLVLDFIPNHVAWDHPWVAEHPERLVAGSQELFERAPADFNPVTLQSGEIRYVARARDPYFPPWSDVAQLDYSRRDTRDAVVAELEKLAEHADGLRCDMAMLVLSDVFTKTWGGVIGSHQESSGEFWTEARRAVPELMLIAEVYWDLEWRLQQLGFDFTYDKVLYDRLVHGPVESVRGHLRAAPDVQTHSARFIENHDEARSATTFGARLPAAAVTMSTIPGMRFCFDGQFEGLRIRLPVQLGQDPGEPHDRRISRFYDRLLPIADASIFHDGEWSLATITGLNASSADLAAWWWKHQSDQRLVVVNLGATVADARVQAADNLPEGSDDVVFDDVLNDERYVRNRIELIEQGLYVRLEGGQAHIFSVSSRR
jgi:hypothetical protein